MTIRWRLGILFVQILAIIIVTKIGTGAWLSQTTWFTSLIALVLNTQLLEPWFARPVDTLANSVVGLVIAWFAPKTSTSDAWVVLSIVLISGGGLSLLALFLGANAEEAWERRIGSTSRIVSKRLTAPVIYGVIFWLSLLEYAHGLTPTFWTLSLTWATTTILGAVDWQRALAEASGTPVLATVEGMIGPNKLLISSDTAPPVGSPVTLSGGGRTEVATVVARVRRLDDVVFEAFVQSPEGCEHLLAARTLDVKVAQGLPKVTLGIVDAESTHERLVFSPLRPLTIGTVVAVRQGASEILYQVAHAEVRSDNIKGGSSLVVRVRADQLGVFNNGSRRIARHRWVPLPGSPVTAPTAPGPELSIPVAGQILLGSLIGTSIPVFLDRDAVAQGHLVILGMTRMGKTSLALRLARAFATTRATTILDQTGEWCRKHGLGAYARDAAHDSTPGLSVFEPAAGEPVPTEGLEHLKHIANLGYQEYAAGNPFPRTIVIDEAHQFVPEPALLGYGAIRDSAVTFGMYMMQIRKYGISATLISQRTAVLAKTALSQCENVIAFKSVDQTGLEYLEAILGPQARDLLPRLNQGEALVFGPAISSDSPVAIEVAR